MILAGIGGGETNLAYEISEGVITISTKEDLQRSTKTEVYDVADLLINVQKFIGQNPNLQQIRILLDGSPTRAYVCTRCLKSGKVQKAV